MNKFFNEKDYCPHCGCLGGYSGHTKAQCMFWEQDRTLHDVELPQPFTIEQYEEFLDIHGRHFDTVDPDFYYMIEAERIKDQNGP